MVELGFTPTAARFASLCIVPLHACLPLLLQAPRLPGPYAKLQFPMQTQLSCNPPCVHPPLFLCPPKPHERINKVQLAVMLQAGWAGGPREASMSECTICSMEPATLPFSTLVPKGGFVCENRLIVANIGHRWERPGTDKEFNWIPLALKTSSER